MHKCKLSSIPACFPSSHKTVSLPGMCVQVAGQHGLTLVAADIEDDAARGPAKKQGQASRGQDVRPLEERGVCLVMGSEGQGLSPQVSQVRWGRVASRLCWWAAWGLSGRATPLTEGGCAWAVLLGSPQAFLVSSWPQLSQPMPHTA